MFRRGDVSELERRFQELKQARIKAGIDSNRVNLIYYLSYGDSAEQKQREVSRLVNAADKADLKLEIDIEQLPSYKESTQKLLQSRANK